mmetsp:Transcript_19967/g.50341  ORF Transcript_19967/g.50341 Transcript_19967/m.50341 type:complete len:532 (+) Transcript_19967:3-1598(+)
MYKKVKDIFSLHATRTATRLSRCVGRARRSDRWRDNPSVIARKTMRRPVSWLLSAQLAVAASTDRRAEAGGANGPWWQQIGRGGLGRKWEELTAAAPAPDASEFPKFPLTLTHLPENPFASYAVVQALLLTAASNQKAESTPMTGSDVVTFFRGGFSDRPWMERASYKAGDQKTQTLKTIFDNALNNAQEELRKPENEKWKDRWQAAIDLLQGYANSFLLKEDLKLEIEFVEGAADFVGRGCGSGSMKSLPIDGLREHFKKILLVPSMPAASSFQELSKVEPPRSHQQQHQLRAAAGETNQHPTGEKTKTRYQNYGNGQPAQELSARPAEQVQATSTNVESAHDSVAAAHADDADSGQRTAEAAIRTPAAVGVPVPGGEHFGAVAISSTGAALGDEPKDGHTAREQLMRRALPPPRARSSVQRENAEANSAGATGFVGSPFAVLQSPTWLSCSASSSGSVMNLVCGHFGTASLVACMLFVLLAVAVGLRSSAKTNEGESAQVEHGPTLHGCGTNYGTNGDEVAGDQPGPAQ